MLVLAAGKEVLTWVDIYYRQENQMCFLSKNTKDLVNLTT